MWFDRWAEGCPLRDKLSVRNIVRSGFLLTDKVSDLISNGAWRWPSDWYNRFPDVVSIPVPEISESRDDCLVWRDHAAMDSYASNPTPIDVVPDSHDHLFFQCSYSFQVWLKVRVLCGMDSISPQMDDILAFLIPISKGRSVVSIIARVVVAATTYFLWMERNSRLFTKKILSVDKLVQSICSTVRLKLVTFRFKKTSPTSRKLLDMWKVPKQCIVHNGSVG
ncbi:hypothetical protein Tco_0429562 [Tanacetum coccineum]